MKGQGFVLKLCRACMAGDLSKGPCDHDLPTVSNVWCCWRLPTLFLLPDEMISPCWAVFALSALPLSPFPKVSAWPPVHGHHARVLRSAVQTTGTAPPVLRWPRQ